MAPDPLSAAGYLQLIPPAVRAGAEAVTTAGEWRMALGWAADGAILFVLLKSGVLPRLGRWLAPRLSRPWLAAPLLALAFCILFEGAGMVVSLAAGALWSAGAPSPAGLVDGLPFRILGDLLAVLAVMGAARRRPRRWWVALGGLCVPLIVLWVLAAPLLLPPAARGDRLVSPPAGAPLLAFAQRGGLKAKALYVFDSADPADVDAEGVGPFAHLAVSRAALAAPQPQTYAALGHLLGHHRHKDLWSMTLLLAALTLLLLALIAKLTAPFARRLGAARALGPADPMALPAVGLIAWAFALPAGMAFDGFDRGINYRADAYALSLTHDPHGLARWLIESETKSKADPAWLEMVVFYDHPPLKARLVRALGPAPDAS